MRKYVVYGPVERDKKFLMKYWYWELEVELELNEDGIYKIEPEIRDELLKDEVRRIRRYYDYDIDLGIHDYIMDFEIIENFAHIWFYLEDTDGEYDIEFWVLPENVNEIPEEYRNKFNLKYDA